MPKRTYKILRFDGGINNDSDPRDIGDNQFAALQNVAVDEMGKIVILGDILDPYKTLASSAADGIAGSTKKFTAISTDHKGFLDGAIEGGGAGPGLTYYLVENGTNLQGVSSDDSESTTVPGLGFDSGVNDFTTYYIDGALRMADGYHYTSAKNPQWRGYIPSKTYGAAGTAASYVHTNSWETEDAEIAGAFPTITLNDGTTACQNAIMSLGWPDAGQGTPSNGYNAGSCIASFNNVLTDTGVNTGTTYVAASEASNMYWGLALGYAENSASSANGTGTWMPTDTSSYKFYVTTMYDDHQQESLPQLFSHFAHSTAGWTTEAAHGGAVSDVAQSFMEFRNGHLNTSTNGENIAVWLSPRLKINNGASTSTFNFGSATAATTSDTGNKRISGLRIYWAGSDDGFATLWQMFDIDFVKGIAPIGMDGGSAGFNYAPWELQAQTNSLGGSPVDTNYIGVDFGTVGQTNKWTNPPRYFQYDVLNGHTPTDIIKVDTWKTSVVSNRRVYLGNIQQDGVIHPDRMIKSPVNQFDKFPSTNNIDVAIHDGDEIKALVEYADRILQFKKNTLYIINVSGSTEFLEAEHKFKGVIGPRAVCRTDYGAAWANRNGCYLYDGEAVTDLLEDQGMRKINSATWTSFIGTTDYHCVGYNPFRRQIIVQRLNTAYIYDMVTKSWTYSSAIRDGISNTLDLINDPLDGSLLAIESLDASIDKWSDTPASNPVIIIKTKDIDFGEPAVRKKVHKVHVSYKGDGSAVTIGYRTDGETAATPGNFYKITSATDGSSSGATDSTTPLWSGTVGTTNWLKAELKPVTSITNINSIQLVFGGTAVTDFEINDISIVFRSKGIK